MDSFSTIEQIGHIGPTIKDSNSLKIFLNQHNINPLGSLFYKQIDPKCKLCKGSNKTLNHILFPSEVLVYTEYVQLNSKVLRWAAAYTCLYMLNKWGKSPKLVIEF